MHAYKSTKRGSKQWGSGIRHALKGIYRYWKHNLWKISLVGKSIEWTWHAVRTRNHIFLSKRSILSLHGKHTHPYSESIRMKWGQFTSYNTSERSFCREAMCGSIYSTKEYLFHQISRGLALGPNCIKWPTWRGETAMRDETCLWGIWTLGRCKTSTLYQPAMTLLIKTSFFMLWNISWSSISFY